MGYVNEKTIQITSLHGSRVPKSSGGPGIILENLMPLKSELNKAKTDVPDKGLFEVASKWNLTTHISQDFLDNFQATRRRRHRDLVIKITKEIWSRSVEERRLFYWCVREKIYPGIDFKSAYERAGVALNFLTVKK